MSLAPIEDPIIVQQMTNAGQEPVQQIQTDTELQTQTKIIKNHPTVKVCNSNNIIVDPTGEGDIDKFGFIL